MWGNLCILYSPPNTSSRLVHVDFVMENFLSPTKIWSSMRRFLRVSVERNTSSLLQLFVLIVVSNVVCHFAMRGNCIRESVMRQIKISFLYILPTSHIQYMIKNTGGVMRGILSSMEESSISLAEHSSKWESWWKTYHDHHSWMPISRTPSMWTIRVIWSPHTSVSMHRTVKTVSMGTMQISIKTVSISVN